MRVFEALRAKGQEREIDALYAEWGRRVFGSGIPAAPDGGLVREIAGGRRISGDALAAADDPAWDERISESMARATELLGQIPITPT